MATETSRSLDKPAAAGAMPGRTLVLVFQVITPHVPLEIVGTVDGRPFYYRARSGRWSLWSDPWDYGQNDERRRLGQGSIFANDDHDLVDALSRITTTFRDMIAQHPMYAHLDEDVDPHAVSPG